MNSAELVMMVNAVAISICDCCSSDDVEILAAVFAQLGDTLATISTYQSICCPSSDDGSDVEVVEINGSKKKPR